MVTPCWIYLSFLIFSIYSPSCLFKTCMIFSKNYPKALNTYHKSDPYDWNSDLFNESFDPVHNVKMRLNVSYINQTFLFLSQTCQIIFFVNLHQITAFFLFPSFGGWQVSSWFGIGKWFTVSENCPWPILYCTKPQKREVKIKSFSKHKVTHHK